MITLFTKSTDRRLLALLLFCLAITLCAVPLFAQTSDSLADWKFSTELQTQGAWHVAQTDVLGTVKLADNTSTQLSLKLGKIGPPVELRVQGADGKALTLTFSAQDTSLPMPNAPSLPLSNAVIQIELKSPDGGQLFKGNYFIRPNPSNYLGEEQEALLKSWDTLPKASEQALRLKVTLNQGNVDIWIDDRFIGGGPVSMPATVQLKLSTWNALGKITTEPTTDKKFVPVGLEGYRHPSLTFDSPELQRGKIQEIQGVPFQVAAVGNDIDVGKSRWLTSAGMNWFTEPYNSRSSFDSVPENILLSVPDDDYSYAHLLCVIDPDPTKTPTLTLRLSRYNSYKGYDGGRGDGIANSVISLEQTAGKWPDGVRQIGTVKAKDAAGKETLMPLLDVAVPMRGGEIPDVIDGKGISNDRSIQYLDLELTKELHLAQSPNYSNFAVTPQGKPSGVNVLGLTLERAAVKVRVAPRHVGNIFYNTEPVGFDLDMTNRTGQKFSGQLSWKLTDYYGKSITGEKKVQLDGANTESKVGLDTPNLGLGWYQADLKLTDTSGNIVWQQPTSLAVLAPDTRKAGAESPFGTWWFRTDHGGTMSFAEMAPLLKRLGFRHVSPGGVQHQESGTEFAKYGISVSMLPWPGGVSLEQSKKALDANVAKYPNAKYAMIFHESGYGSDGAFAPEFIGKAAPVLNEQQRASYDNQMSVAIPYARYIREKYPQLKLIVGNGASSFTWGLMQNGYPKDLVDYWGDEGLGQSIIPEAPTSNLWYWIDQYSKKYGYNKPLTSAYEWRGRGTSPGNLTELEQAQFYTRDVLMAMAYDAPNINPGMLYDVGDIYYYSRWGSGGFLRRYPLLNPKISYVAMSVLTQQLDQAKFSRVMATGSPSLNAIEFRQGNGWVYAMWVPRGEKQATLSFEANAGSPSLVDMNGRSLALKINERQASISVSDSPSYLHSGVRLSFVTGGATTIPAPPKEPIIADSMTDVANWKVVDEPDKTLEEHHFDVPRQLGNITVKSVSDDQKQHALELTLQPEPNVPWPIGRYITLQAKQPVVLQGDLQHVGIWVKGNSSWGRIFFELKDASGKSFYSIGALDDGWNLLDWKGKTYVDFDGWNYISMKLPHKYMDGFDEPQQGNWYLEKGVDVKYPVKVTKIVVQMRDKVVQIDHSVDVPNPSIRFYGLGGY